MGGCRQREGPGDWTWSALNGTSGAEQALGADHWCDRAFQPYLMVSFGSNGPICPIPMPYRAPTSPSFPPPLTRHARVPNAARYVGGGQAQESHLGATRTLSR